MDWGRGRKKPRWEPPGALDLGNAQEQRIRPLDRNSRIKWRRGRGRGVMMTWQGQPETAGQPCVGKEPSRSFTPTTLARPPRP